MHFYSCARRQESADWSNKAKTEFRKLVHAIYSAATPGSYQAARRALHTWTEKKAKRGHAKKWFEGFWHPRRFHAFRVFKSSTTANTNMAEVGHARNAVRGARNDTLSRAAEDHVVECALLKGKLEQYEQGNYAGGKCPSQKQKNEMSLRKQVDRAGVFAKELALGIDLDSYHAEVFVDKNSSHRAKATTAQVSMTADPLEMQSSDEDELQPSKKMKPKYRKRTTRSKQFEQSLKLAKRARLTLDDVHDVSETQKVFELNDNGNIRLVEIGETPTCNCTFGQGKNVCFHMIWVMMNVLKVNERDEILFQKMLTSSMVKTLFKNLAKDVSQERSGPESSMNSVSGTSSTSVMVSGQSFLHDLQSRDRENFPRATAAAHSSMSSASGNCSSTDIHVSSGSFLQELQSVGRDNSTGPSTPSGLMDSVSENSSSTVMSFLHELEPVSSVSYATPSASNSSVTSNSGNSSNTVMSSNSFLHELQSFGGDINARPPATHSSVNSASGNCSTTFGGAYARPSPVHSSVNSASGNCSTTFGGAYARPSPVHSSVNSASGNCSTTFGGAYARPPAAYSPVFTRPPWHNSNPFVVVNLINRIKKCAGCPFPFRDAQGPVYLGVAVKHVEKDVYFDKASSTQRVTNEGNRYYHCQVSCITSRHPYFSPAMLRADPDLLLDDFQRYSLNSVFGVSF